MVMTRRTELLVEAVEFTWAPLPLAGRLDLFEMSRQVALLNKHLARTFGSGLGPFVVIDVVEPAVRFRFLSGQVTIGPLTFLVRPRFMEPEDWVKRLAGWVSLGHSRRPRALALLPGAVAASSLPTGLTDLLALHYLRLLRQALAEHPLLTFDRVISRREALRGRLLVERTARQLPHQQHLLYCAYTQLRPHSPSMRLLAWAGEELARHTHSAAIARELSLLVEPFQTGAAGRPEPVDAGALRLATGSRAYEEPLAIANALMLGASPAVASGVGRRRAAPFVVCTYDAFEGLVSAVWAHVAERQGLTHSEQSQVAFAQRVATPAVAGATANQDSRHLRPDDLLRDDYPTGRPRRIVSDTKYRGPAGTPARTRLPEVRESDLYQVLTASITHQADVSVIVQPMPEGLPQHRLGVEKITMSASTTSLSRDHTVAIIRLDLREEFGRHGRTRLAQQFERALDEYLS